nr:uncharacterized protein LOC111992218 isoform X1 [Quercus suber]
MVEGVGYAWAPIGIGIGGPLNSVQREEQGRHFDDSVNAVSFGFVATAILISMFLVMAIFERFLRPASPALSPPGHRTHRDLEAQMGYNAKLAHPSPKCHQLIYKIKGLKLSMKKRSSSVPKSLSHLNGLFGSRGRKEE